MSSMYSSLALRFGGMFYPLLFPFIAMRKRFSSMYMVLALSIVLAPLNVQAVGTTFTVINTNNSGAGSLRQAILDSNSNAGKDTIAFNIPGTSPHSIQPLSQLPTISDPVVIDGWTQPGFAGSPVIVVNGINAGSAQGIFIATNNSLVRGLVINNFSIDGIVIAGGGSNNQLSGNYIGTDFVGTTALPNGRNGIRLAQGAESNVIGTNGDGVADETERNVVSGNIRQGIALIQGSTNNVIAGNYIGTDISGMTALGNGLQGVLLAASPLNRVGTDGDGVADVLERNIISGNSTHGVQIGAIGAEGNIVAGNYIGTDKMGISALGNGTNGVFISNGAISNLVGTDGDGIADGAERNIISANGMDGVHINGFSVLHIADNNVVAGNYIGTDVTGTSALGNNRNGVLMARAEFNTIGTNGDGMFDAIERTIISGNTAQGVLIFLSSANNVVAGNRIGIDVTGMLPIGNGLHGVRIADSSGSNQIGTNADDQNDVAERNIIAFNSSNGIASSDTGIGNLVRQNSIYSNGVLGIDLDNDGVTLNDLQDIDAGPNNLQNFPELLASQAGVTTHILGSLNSTPGTTFDIEFFANTTADPSGFGEGERFLGTTIVTTDTSGDASFDVLLSAASVAGEFLTATATDPSGNTSEFSGTEDILSESVEEQVVVDIIEDIQDLVDAGTLNGGNGNALISKLEAVLAKIDKGNTNAAINQINAFINQVNAFVAKGKLTSEEGLVLIDLANIVLAQL